MKIRRFNMVSAGDDWTYHVVCVDREENGEWCALGRPMAGV
jgi:hypothetical protein